MAKVKICGITNLDDALVAIEYGADALGFIFARSPRQVTAEVVREITSKLPPFITKVGVFVDSELKQVTETISLCNLDLAQLHGNENIDYCAALYPRVVKTFTINNLPSDQELIRYRVAAFMLDKDKTGSGDEAEIARLWHRARDLRKHGPVILAGGLNPDNVVQAIETVDPYAVDVSSGVEAGPGKKDHDKLSAFIKAAKHVKPGGNIVIT